MKLPQASLTESCADDRIGPMAVQVFDDPGVQTEQVEELDRREIVRVWRDWNATYPLEPKPHAYAIQTTEATSAGPE